MSYKRTIQERNKMIKLYKATYNTYGVGVWYDKKAQRYKYYWLSYKTGYPRYLKRLCNKRIRKYDGVLKRNNYRKFSEFRWMLY